MQRQSEGVGDAWFCYCSIFARACLVALDTEMSEGLVKGGISLYSLSCGNFDDSFIVESLNGCITMTVEIVQLKLG